MTCITVEIVAADGAPQRGRVEATPDMVAASLAAGHGIGPVMDGHGARAAFIGAGWAFVQIDGPADHIGRVLDFEFTATNAGAVCLRLLDAGIRCILGFVLPQQVQNVGDYRAVIAGLAVVYGVAPRKDYLAAWRMDGGGEAVSLPGTVTPEALATLRKLGSEELHRRRYRTDGAIRSEVRLPRDAVVTLADGDSMYLPALAAGTSVRCPVHADFAGTAEVVDHEGRRGIYCPHCRRTYWSGPARPGHDFTQFRRGLEELHAQQRAEIGDVISPDLRLITLLSERYLPPLRLQPGYTLVRSPKGTGKTAALESLVAQCKGYGKRVLLIGHRRSLLGNLAGRLKLNLYFEAEDEDARLQGDAGIGNTIDRSLLGYEIARPAQSLADLDPKGTAYFAICLDSIPRRLNPAHERYDVVIVDESEQVVQHLVSDTLKRVRRDAFFKLLHYLGCAESVYLLDADLDVLTWSLGSAAIEAYAGRDGSRTPDIRFLINDPPVAERTFEVVGSQPLLMAALIDAVRAGGKTYVACNSLREVQKVAAYLRSMFPGKRIVDVTSANSQEPEIGRLLLDLPGEYERDLDVLIVSPALGTGVDISFDGGRCGVDHVFGMFYGDIVTHFDIDQQLCRVRNPGSVKIWIDPRGRNHETAPQVIERELRHTVLRTDLVIGYDRSGRPAFTDSDATLVALWAKIMAMQRASKNDLLARFSELRAENGWRAETAPGTEEDSDRGKAALAAGKEQREAERTARILAAEDIDSNQADELVEKMREGLPITESEQAMLDRYWLTGFYVCPVDEALIEFDDEGRTRPRIALLELLHKDEEDLIRHDRFQVEKEFDLRPRYYTKWRKGKEEPPRNDHVRNNPSKAPIDRDFWSAKAEILKALCRAAGVLDPATGEFLVDTEVTSAGLSEFVALFRRERRRIESELGLLMRRDIVQKPVQQLGDLLRLIGLDLVKVAERKVGKSKERVYRVDGARYMGLLEIIVRREQRRLMHRAERTEDDERRHADADSEASSSGAKSAETAMRKSGAADAKFAAALARCRKRDTASLTDLYGLDDPAPEIEGRSAGAFNEGGDNDADRELNISRDTLSPKGCQTTITSSEVAAVERNWLDAIKRARARSGANA